MRRFRAKASLIAIAGIAIGFQGLGIFAVDFELKGPLLFVEQLAPIDFRLAIQESLDFRSSDSLVKRGRVGR